MDLSRPNARRSFGPASAPRRTAAKPSAAMEQYQQQQQVYQANIVSSDKLRQDKKQAGDQYAC